MIVVARQEFSLRLFDSLIHVNYTYLFIGSILRTESYYIFMLKSLSHSAFSSMPFGKLCQGLPGCCCTVAPLHVFIGCQAAFEILGSADEFWHLGPRGLPMYPRFHMVSIANGTRIQNAAGINSACCDMRLSDVCSFFFLFVSVNSKISKRDQDTTYKFRANPTQVSIFCSFG